MEKPELRLTVLKQWKEEGRLINTGNIAFREKIDKKEQITITGNSIHELFMKYSDLVRRYKYCNDVRITLKIEDIPAYKDWYAQLSSKDLHYIEYGNSTVN